MSLCRSHDAGGTVTDKNLPSSKPRWWINRQWSWLPVKQFIHSGDNVGPSKASAELSAESCFWWAWNVSGLSPHCGSNAIIGELFLQMAQYFDWAFTGAHFRLWIFVIHCQPELNGNLSTYMMHHTHFESRYHFDIHSHLLSKLSRRDGSGCTDLSGLLG